MRQDDMLVLVTGGTGYVGGRVIPRLLHAGYRVRALVRDPERLQGRPWYAQVEVVAGDVMQAETLPAAMSGVAAAYYLIHSTHGSHDVQDRDATGAQHFGQAALTAGVRRIICLSGLGQPTANFSPRLGSRQDTGQALRAAGTHVTEFRTAIIVGSGSISFEIVRNLTERMPVMLCPRWVFTRVQPIAIRDVLSYLIAALDVPESAGQVIEIGGAHTTTYGQMIAGYAHARGLRRLLIPLPILAPRLSAYCIHWLTPIPAGIARPLIEGMRHDVVVHDDTARQLFPQIQPLDYSTALLLAVERTEAGQVETSWSDALATSQGDTPVVPLSAVSITTEQGVIIEQRQRLVAAPPERVFQIVAGLGGQRGWLYFGWAWVLRGLVDRLLGGVGSQRGRRQPNQIHTGDPVDFWRVEKAEDNRLLRLRAEMRAPGRAWLEFQAHPQPDAHTSLTQRAFFAPKGLPGLAYWYILYPIHSLIFSGLIREIARRAEQMPIAETPE